MPTPIILASASAQRRKLLRMTGLKFSVKPSRADESADLAGGCARLVKQNALVKAREVARRFKSGIVIGADTVVYAAGRLILKPKHLKEAREILHTLYTKPHWVYTGVGIIDAATGREIADYEKTRIYMQKLADEEITRYHASVSPLDKAGGFDIEGKGGLFISRIEGCYSNVIGLPMPKLRIMLKKFGVSLLSAFLMATAGLTLTGCASEFNLATGQEESLIFGTEQEVNIGVSASNQVEKQFKLVEGVEENRRLQEILAKIVAVCDRKDIIYTIKIVDDERLNAVSLPGGPVYIFRGLMDKLKTDDELAGVIAHEVGHITARHGIKRLQASYGYTLLQLAAFAAKDGDAAQGANALFTFAFLAYSRGDEFQADELGVKYTKKAGYDPQAMLKVLQVLKDEEQRAPKREFSYFRTHPYLSERMAVVNKEINGQIGFKDYLNLTGQDL